jgi:hypothetical protein
MPINPYLAVALMVFLGIFLTGAHAGWRFDWAWPIYLGAMLTCGALGYCLGAFAKAMKTLF